MHKNRKGFSYYLIRFLTAILGLVLGAGLFLWNSLDQLKFFDLRGIRENVNTENVENSENLDKYKELARKSDGDYKHVELNVDPDYPINFVEQKDKNVKNILVFGIDSRGEIDARADTIMILTINQNDKSIKLTSVLRDTEMSLNDGFGIRTKVNASYAYGGVGMLINTLNYNLDLDIQEFVMFDFWSAKSFIDDLGGVTLTVSEEELLATNQVMQGMTDVFDFNYEDYALKNAGSQKLNGIQALAWGRVRSIDSDFGRTNRQRILAETMIVEFSKKNVLAQGSFALSIIDDLSSNLDKMSLVSNGTKAIMYANNIKKYNVPQEGMYETNYENWNMIMYPELQIPDLHNFIWGE